MDEATVEVVRTEAEAELLCSLLRNAGIRCMQRPTNQGVGAADGVTFGVGPREIVVNAADLAAAREVLEAQRSGN
jgi:hypothetical protein